MATVNVLDRLTDTEIWNLQLALNLSCGRAKSPLTAKRRKVLCTLAGQMLDYSASRGLPSPTAPYHAGDYKA